MAWQVSQVDAVQGGMGQGGSDDLIRMAGWVAMTCMALNVNGLHMYRKEGRRQEGKEVQAQWRAGRKLVSLYVRARREGWSLMVLSETHCGLEELKAMTIWWRNRGYQCWGSPGLGRGRAGVCVVWRAADVKVSLYPASFQR